MSVVLEWVCVDSRKSVCTVTEHAIKTVQQHAAFPLQYKKVPKVQSNDLLGDRKTK
jgi:hypothetical protein